MFEEKLKVGHRQLSHQRQRKTKLLKRRIFFGTIILSVVLILAIIFLTKWLFALLAVVMVSILIILALYRGWLDLIIYRLSKLIYRPKKSSYRYMEID